MLDMGRDPQNIASDFHASSEHNTYEYTLNYGRNRKEYLEGH